MAVDFYNLTDRECKTLLFQLDGNDYKCLGDVFVQYKKLTGLCIDQYDDTKISQGHIELIIKLITEKINTTLQIDKQQAKHLQQIFVKFQQSTEGLLAVGD